jgi:hypothetical protein
MAGLALHRVRFDLGHGVRLEFETTQGRGQPLATPWPDERVLSVEEELDAAALASGGMLPMAWRDAGQLFEPFQLREDTEYFVDVSVPIDIDEAMRQAQTHEAWPFDQRLATVFTRDPPRRWRQGDADKRPHTVITGLVRLRSHAGVISFSTPFGGSLRAEVVCRKLRYFDEFKALLDSLAEKAAELLLAYDAPVSAPFAVHDELATNDAALHFLMRHVMAAGNLPLAAEEILANPHASLVERVDVASIEEIEEAHDDLIVDQLDTSSLMASGPLARLFGGYTPRELPRREMFESYDTPENRYAKAFLEHCRMNAQRLESRMAWRKRPAAEREARGWRLTLDEVLQHGLWRASGPLGHVPANSQVLLRKRGYKDLLRFDVALRMSLGLAWQQGADLADGLIGDIRPVNQIYEYWCFFTLRDILRSFCKDVGGGNFLTVSPDGLRVQLVKGRRSECRFEYLTATGPKVAVSLFYNRRFNRSRSPRTDWSGSYTALFDPDFSIAARPAGASNVGHWLHFDAKYRLERQQAEALFESADGNDQTSSPAETADYEAELSRVHKQDDLFKMHTYRDGILSTRGAYVLFPGDGIGGRGQNPHPNFFVRHPSALGAPTPHTVPSVGVFPLTPDGGTGQLGAVRDLLRSVFDTITQGTSYAEERAFFGPHP